MVDDTSKVIVWYQETGRSEGRPDFLKANDEERSSGSAIAAEVFMCNVGETDGTNLLC